MLFFSVLGNGHIVVWWHWLLVMVKLFVVLGVFNYATIITCHGQGCLASYLQVQQLRRLRWSPKDQHRQEPFQPTRGSLNGYIPRHRNKTWTRAPSRQFFPQKFCVKSELTPVFLSKNLSLECEIATILNSRHKYAFRTNIEFSSKCIYLQLKPI